MQDKILASLSYGSFLWPIFVQFRGFTIGFTLDFQFQGFILDFHFRGFTLGSLTLSKEEYTVGVLYGPWI